MIGMGEDALAAIAETATTGHAALTFFLDATTAVASEAESVLYSFMD